MNPTLNRILQEACSAAGTGVQQFLDDYCFETEAAAKERQRTSDIKAAVLSFIDLKVDEATMYRLLQKHFKVDTNEGFTVSGIPISTLNKLYVAMTRSKGNLYLMSAKSFKKIKRDYLHG